MLKYLIVIPLLLLSLTACNDTDTKTKKNTNIIIDTKKKIATMSVAELLKMADLNITEVKSEIIEDKDEPWDASVYPHPCLETKEAKDILSTHDKNKIIKWGKIILLRNENKRPYVYEDKILFKYDFLNKLISSNNITVAEYFVNNMKVPDYHYEYDYRNILKFAYSKENKKLLLFLIEYPELLGKNNYRNFFKLVSKNGNDSLLTLIYKKDIIDSRTVCECAKVAVIADNVKILNYFINNESTKEVLACRDMFSNSLLFDSAEKTTQILIDNGVNMEIIDAYRTALGSSFGRKTMVLIKAGANLKYEDPNGNMPIHLASGAIFPDEDEQMKKRIISIAAMLNAGIDVNIQTYKGISPLMRAAESGDLAVVKALLTWGADLNQEDDYHKTALAYSIDKDNVKVASYLYNLGGRMSKRSYDGSIVNRAVSKNAIKVISYFLDVEQEQRKEEVKTAFYDMNAITEYLSSYGDIDVIKMLVEHGYDVNAQSKFSGITPLHLARSLEMAKYLVEHGAVLKKDRNGETPLDQAIKDNASKEYIEYLSSLK